MAKMSTTDKGKILEELVAMLHQGPDVTVQQRVKLPTRFNAKRKREIDILVTGSVAGHRVQLAIECKNLKNRPVETQQIGDFASRLQQVGLAPSQGIFVTTTRFTEDALDHARSLNMKTLIFPDLGEDRLNLVVSEALQSIVFLLPEVERFWIANDLDEPITEVGDAFMLYDQDGAPAGTIPDFVWDAWRKGRIAHTIGTHVLAFQLPDGWYNLIAGEKRFVQQISIVVKVIGLAITLRGESRSQSLVDAADGRLERQWTEMQWVPAEDRYELRSFESYETLEAYVRSEPTVHVVSQLALPRIRFWNMMFWPPSERVARIINARMEAFLSGRGPDPRPFNFTELEGSDLSAAWEPIAREYIPEDPQAA